MPTTATADTSRRSDQPTGITENEIPRAPPESITTSDGPAPVVERPRTRKADTAAADPDSEQDGADPSDPASDDEERQKRTRHRKRSAERQIARLKADLAERDRRDTEREQRIADLEARITATPKPPKAKEPVITDFNTPKDYAKAYAKWELEQTADATPPPARRAAPPAATQPPPMIVDPEVTSFHAKCTKALGVERLQEIQDTPGLQVDKDMAEFIMDADHGPTLYAWLADNVEESRRISGYGAVRKAKALADLAAKAEAGLLDDDDDDDDDVPEIRSARRYDEPDEDDEEPKARKGADRSVTRAPKPPSDTRPRSNAPTAPDLAKLSMDDYAQQRRKDLLRAKGRIV